jgi:hypothetical protein
MPSKRDSYSREWAKGRQSDWNNASYSIGFAVGGDKYIARCDKCLETSQLYVLRANARLWAIWHDDTAHGGRVGL